MREHGALANTTTMPKEWGRKSPRGLAVLGQANHRDYADRDVV